MNLPDNTFLQGGKYRRGCVKMMHPLFCYIIIGFSFFIESDFSFSVFLSNTHSSLWYNGL